MDKSEMTPFWDVPELRGLKRHEKEKIEELLENPGREEVFFLRQLIGKTPAQVRNLIIDEFIRRFDLNEYTEEIRKLLPSKRSWRDLDIALSGFGGMVEVEEHRLFVDRMRYVLAALPQKKDFNDKYTDSHSRETTKPKRGWAYDMCKFCWRSVPHRAGVLKKSGLLCFEHNLPSTHSTYRKRKRLHKQMVAERRQILESLEKMLPHTLSDAEMREATLSLMTTPNGSLPRLAEYLAGSGHDSAPESLLWAFHGPASDEMEPLYREALVEFIQNILTAENKFNPGQPLPLIFTMDELSSAEAWLTVLDRDNRRKSL